jgi:hypothetical protein
MPRRLAVACFLALAVACAAAPPDCRSLPRVIGPVDIPDRFRAASPMRHWRTASWSSACRNLNLCYSRLGVWRGECDQTFRRDLEFACKAAYDRWGEEGARDRCLLAARLMHGRLIGEAPSGYRDAQYEARWTEDAGPRRLPFPKRKWGTEERPPPEAPGGARPIPTPRDLTRSVPLFDLDRSP